EAADIDGANPIQKFFKITVPLLKPVVLFTSITSTIGTLQLFDEPMNITQGGPGDATITVSQYIYNLSFKYTPDFGYASAVSFVIALVIMILSLVQLKVGNREDYESTYICVFSYYVDYFRLSSLLLNCGCSPREYGRDAWTPTTRGGDVRKPAKIN